MTKFDYTIFKDNSQSEFKKACKLIERSFPDAKTVFPVWSLGI